MASAKTSSWLSKLDKSISRGLLFRFSQILATVCGVSISLLGLVTFVTVVGRLSPWAGAWLSGGVEVSELLMGMVSVLAITYVWYIGGHIRIGLFRERSRPRNQAILDLFSALCGIILVVIIAWGVWRLGMSNRVHGVQTWALEIPVAPFQVVFSIVMAHFVLALLRSLLGFLARARGRPVEHDGLY